MNINTNLTPFPGTRKSALEQLSAHLYRFKDTCNVYILVSGDQALLVDFGAGEVLPHLAQTRANRVSAVLMTHHHRDQGQGLPRALAAGAQVWVPHTEQDLFARVDEHWQSRELWNNYNSRQDRFSLLEPIEITGTLQDYAAFRFGEFELTVLPTPGHTPGSLSLLAQIDGQRVVFSGDLIYAPGKVWSMAATQWSYNGGEGLALSIASLLDLQDRQPDLLLPSHGEPICNPQDAIQLLVERFRQLMAYREQNPRFFSLREKPYVAITPHLLFNRTSMANSYVLLSDTRQALLIDFGYDFIAGIAPGADRAAHRPWLYTLPMLKRDFGVEKIAAALPTHTHDDHVAGLNLLRQVEGAEIWAPASFARVLEQPQDYNLPCLWYDPIPVDRLLPLGEPIRWEEHHLTLHALPGHSLHAVAIYFEVDGVKVVCTGDQYQVKGSYWWNYVYPNRFDPADYRRSAELMRRLEPDVILGGHWEPLWRQPGTLKMLEEGGEILERLHHDLLPEELGCLSADQCSLRLQPYQAEALAGEAFRLRVEITNPLPFAETACLRLMTPQGWQVANNPVELRLAPGEEAGVEMEVTPPPGMTARRARLAINLDFGGVPYGQVAEALVNVRLP